MNHLSISKGMLALAIVGGALFAGCRHHDNVIIVPTQAAAPQAQPATNTIIVREAPPPPREQSLPPGPVPSDKAWEPAHWEYVNNNYTWVEGRWVDKPRPTAEYVPPHWENRSEGWVYISGSWK